MKCSLVHVILQLNVIPHLLFAMGNTSYTESQRQACATLQVNI